MHKKNHNLVIFFGCIINSVGEYFTNTIFLKKRHKFDTM